MELCWIAAVQARDGDKRSKSAARASSNLGDNVRCARTKKVGEPNGSGSYAASRRHGHPDKAAAERFPPYRSVCPLCLLVCVGMLVGCEDDRAAPMNLHDEYQRLQRENDHVAQQARRRPGRAVALFLVNPLRPYAHTELARCRCQDDISKVENRALFVFSSGEP